MNIPLEKLFLRRLVVDRVGSLTRTIQKYERLLKVTDIDCQERLAMLSSELVVMQELLRKIDNDIALFVLSDPR